MIWFFLLFWSDIYPYNDHDMKALSAFRARNQGVKSVATDKCFHSAFGGYCVNRHKIIRHKRARKIIYYASASSLKNSIVVEVLS